MKASRALTAVIALVIGFVTGPSAATAASPFPDKNLDTAIRGVLQYDTKSELTDEKLLNVYVLEAPGKEIKDLTGLEKCKNLALLNLAKNQVSDLKPLAGLTNLQGRSTSPRTRSPTWHPLAALTKLQYLELSGQQGSFRDLKPLAAFDIPLGRLYLAGNDISDPQAPHGDRAAVVTLARSQQDQGSRAAGEGQPAQPARPQRQSGRRPQPALRPDRPENPDARTEPDSRTGPARQGGAGRFPGLETVRPLPTPLPRRQPVDRCRQGRADRRPQEGRRASRGLLTQPSAIGPRPSAIHQATARSVAVASPSSS